MNDPIHVHTSRRFGTLSPLRYPGGKATLAGLFADIIGSLQIDCPLYIEPYAGGAGAGIALLRQGIVERIAINDIDPAVHAFWRSVVDDNAKLIEKVATTPVTIAEWRKQREIYQEKDENNLLNLGFAFFFLNRTNRSGILNAGAIGGQKQEGNYKIDARFNRATLIERLSSIGQLRDRIDVTDLDGRTIIKNYSQNPSAFMYVDPPYVQAGSQLYLNSFDGRDHIALSVAVGDIERAHWLITYDTAPLIEKLYSKHFQCRLALMYSAHNPGKAEELMVASQEVGDIIMTLHSNQNDRRVVTNV